MKQLRIIALCLAVPMFTGCLDWFPEFGIPAGEEPWGELNPVQYWTYSMHDSPATEDQEEGMLLPAPGALDTRDRPYPYMANEATKSADLQNPVQITNESLKYGKLMYETTCVVCHGPAGKGNGYVVPAYPQPPDLTAARVRAWSDGEIYHVISQGQGRMWSYKNQLSPLERWTVVNYVRALQRAEYPEPEDLERVTDK